MGQSTDAILCFGIKTEYDEMNGEELPWALDDDNDDFEDWYAYKFLEWDGESYADLYGPTGILKKTPPKFKVVRYCSCDAPMYILALAETVTEVSRGYTEQIDPLRMLGVSTPNALSEIEEFAIANGIELSDNPHERGWLLVSDWC